MLDSSDRERSKEAVDVPLRAILQRARSETLTKHDKPARPPPIPLSETDANPSSFFGLDASVISDDTELVTDNMSQPPLSPPVHSVLSFSEASSSPASSPRSVRPVFASSPSSLTTGDTSNTFDRKTERSSPGPIRRSLDRVRMVLTQCCDKKSLPKFNLSWTVQLFLVVALTTLILCIALLFNVYALSLINNTASQYLSTSLSQSQDAVQSALMRVCGSVKRVSSAAQWDANLVVGGGGEAAVAITPITFAFAMISVGAKANAFEGDSSSSSSSAVPSAFQGNTVVIGDLPFANWTTARVTAQISAAYSCRCIQTTEGATLAYRILYDGYVGGCITVDTLSAASNAFPDVDPVVVSVNQSLFLGNVATISFVVANSSVIWLQNVSGISDTNSLGVTWKRVIEHLGFARNMSVSMAFLNQIWGFQHTHRNVFVDAEVAPSSGGDSTTSLIVHNTTWLTSSYPNGSLSTFDLVQLCSNFVRTNKTSLSRVYSLSVLNVSSAMLSRALNAVSMKTSQGVSVELVDRYAPSSAAVLAWAATTGYYVPPESFIEAPVLVTQRLDAGCGSSLLQQWVVRVDSGTSIVGSLAQGTNVVLVVSAAIVVAVSLTGVMTLRLLLNPLAQVTRDIRHAVGLNFGRIDVRHFPPSVLREMNLVTQSFLWLVTKLRGYRGVLLDAYDVSTRKRSSSQASSLSLGDEMSSSSFAASGSQSFSSSNGGGDFGDTTSFGSGTFSPTSFGGTVVPEDDDHAAFLQELRSNSFAEAMLAASGSGQNGDDAENAQTHTIRVHLAYISRRHKGKQRRQVTFEHSYTDGDAELFHKFQKDCLRSLSLNEFEEVRLFASVNGVSVHIASNGQAADAIAAARGELVMHVIKSSVKKILSPVALIMDLVNFVVNITLIAAVMSSTRPGTDARLSIVVFFGLYVSSISVNLGITLYLLKQGQAEPRMKDWLSQAGLEVSLMLIFCAINTQHIHFLWSQWSLGLKFNAPRSRHLWRLGIQYSLFGFCFLDVMQVLYKSYRVVQGEDYLILTLVGMFTAMAAIALSLKKRVHFVRFLWRRRSLQRNRASNGDEFSLDEAGDDETTLMRRPRAGLSCPMMSEEATVVIIRYVLALPETSRFSVDPKMRSFGRKTASELNRFFSLSFNTITTAGGHVLYNYGNEVAAVFNCPKRLDHHQQKALKCMFQLQTQLAHAASAASSSTDPAAATTDKQPMVVIAITSDQYIFGTVGSSYRKTFQCFADWDELSRMLDFAECTKSVSIVSSRRYAQEIKKSMSSPHIRRGGAVNRNDNAGSAVRTIQILHDVLGKDQQYVELRPVVAGHRLSIVSSSSPLHSLRRESNGGVPLTCKILRSLGVTTDPSDRALRVLVRYAQQFVRGDGIVGANRFSSQSGIPMEEYENQLPAKKKVVVFCDPTRRETEESYSASPGRKFGGSSIKRRAVGFDAASPEAPNTHAAGFGGGGDSNGEGVDDDDLDEASGLSSQSVPTSSASSKRSGRYDAQNSRGVSLGHKDMKRLFPAAFGDQQ